jgi:hypothetical protein
MNVECKFYADFPFHLLLTGECKVIDAWLTQLLDVEDEGDMNILFMKFNRKGRYVAVQKKLLWNINNYVYYNSSKLGEWYIMEFDSFFQFNKTNVETYSGTKPLETDTKSILELV